ncbi:hypothetical protein C8R45DRAFT_1079218 [Mycena sanguinolenta]|nr:hypothetical protein C8R45DRAFT_1079218 [Mycena sanguinolenta]
MSATLSILSSLGLSGSLGALAIGTLVGGFLFGIGTLQTFNYYRDFPKDSNLLKAAVGLVWVLELGHTISAAHALFSETVTFYGQPQYIISPPATEATTILFAAPIYTIVQAFFANRVRVLSGRWEVMALACVLGVVRFVAHIGISMLVLHFRRVSIILEWRWLVATSLSLDLSMDLLVTGSLCYCLWNMRSCDSKRTRTMVDTLILWAIESTMVTSAASVIQITLFLTRTDLVWAGVFLIQSKLFSNAMLASNSNRLNGRQRFRDDNAVISDINFGFSHPKMWRNMKGELKLIHYAWLAGSNSGGDTWPDLTGKKNVTITVLGKRMGPCGFCASYLVWWSDQAPTLARLHLVGQWQNGFQCD